MEWILVVINVVLTILLGLFIKNYLPSYMDEKGKNLATKEDIQEITRKTEEVQKEFKEGFEYFSSDLRFKYDFYHKQYSELYSKIYAIVIQSEYVRRFIQITKGQEHSFEEIETPISQFNKRQLCDYIIENGEYATQELLKIAVSYRFAYSHYEGNPEVKNSSCADAANDEEFRLIRDMVCCIVKEYNYFRKELKMNYNHSELESGIPQL